MKLNLEPTERFTTRVDDYVKFRPGYPPEMMEFLRDHLGLTPDKTVADVGSGTGILTRLLLEKGNEVFAVEPNEKMRLAAEGSLQGHPRYHSVPGRAEKTTLPDHSVHMIFVAQAFHWFDPDQTRREFQRILKDRGLVVLIWNEREITGTPFAEGYEKLLVKLALDYDSIKVHGLKSRGVLEDFFGTRPVLQKRFSSVQVLNFEQLWGRLKSASYCPPPGHPNFQHIMTELKKLFDAHQKGNLIEVRYDTNVYFGPLP